MSNPYQPPQFANQPTQPYTPGIDREKLRRVAKYQQWVLYALLAGVVIYFVAGATMRAPMGIRFPISMVFLAIGLFSMVAIFLLTNEMSNPILAIFCALLMILPCIGLLALAFVTLGRRPTCNSMASKSASWAPTPEFNLISTTMAIDAMPATTSAARPLRAIR